MKTIKRITGKILLLILAFLCLQIAVSAANESATEISFQLGEGEEYTEGDYRYVIVTDKKNREQFAKITKYTGTDWDVQIPSELGGIPVKIIGSGSFWGNSTVEYVVIPEGVTEIEAYAFNECEWLIDVELPETVETIGSYAFCLCEYLETINLSKSLTRIEEHAFDGCFSLKKIVIPDSVYYMGPSAFASCTSLKSAVLSENLVEIPDGAFCGCKKLAQITLPSELISVGYMSFGGTQLKSITIPATVTKIGDYAFCDSMLEEINFLGAGTNLGEGVFSGCIRLKQINLPSTTKQLGMYMFAGCVSLESITIPKNVTRIDEWAFSDCHKLSSIVIPAKVEYIGEYAFVNDEALKTIQFVGDAPEFGEQAFENVQATVYYPTGNATWTKAVMQNYGGEITWKSKKPPVDTEEEAQIVTQPKTGYAKMGETAKVTVKAKGDGISYQWYFKNVGSKKYTKSSITSASYSAKMSDKVKDRKVYCVITDEYGNSVQTKTVMVREAASIVTEPKNTYVKNGKTAKVNLEASGDGLTYTWYIKNAGKDKYSKSSVTKSTYSCKMNDTSKDRYVYCVVTDQYGKTVKSKTIVLRMAASIITQPKNVTVKEGKSAKVTVEAVGDGLTYQWYIKNEGSSKFSKSSITKATYSAKMSDKVDGRQVYCVVTDKYGKTVKSSTVTLSMK